MDPKANLPPPPAPLRPAAAGDANLTTTTSSSSSSSSSASPPDFLRHINAVFKRHRPLGTMLQSNVSRAGRILAPQPAPSNNNNNCKRAPAGVARVPLNSPEESSTTPPSITGTVTINSSPFDDAAPAADSSKASSDDDPGLAFQKGAVDDNERDKGGIGPERRDELRHEQQYMDAATQSSFAGTTCATTMSVHTGPTFHCTRAPAGQTAFVTQMSSSAADVELSVRDHVLPEGRGVALKEGDGLQDHKHAPQLGDNVQEKDVSGNPSGLQSDVPSENSMPLTNDASHSSKAEKAPRKKKYNTDVFFKVNGKLYQKLGKIGSGGSSEVHKVITSDCTIYALKKINLKGRDYQTAYGFCQEIEYLNRLKGKSNIIQLIDYEVTDKTLLQGVMNGTVMSTRDGRIRDDQYIYMVLEYGEIDLAHMLSHKWKQMDSLSWKIDENWLRFYWQQMLEAVSKIHEERIVHSDLKPANFLLVRGSLKLIDFGIAKAILSDTTNIQRDAQVGTLNYMSPEAFMWNEQDANGNTIKCGRPSDIWSLGCILYQMVYGKTPFSEYKTFWAKFKVITDKNHVITYEPVSNPWLIDLMKRCLAWDRNERRRIPELLQHPFLVPPMPKQVLPCEDLPCKLLMQKVGVYWDDPEVSKLCSELHEVVAKIEKRKRDLGQHS